MKANMYKTSKKNLIVLIVINTGQNQLKKIQWFPFLTIMEHTANKMQDDERLISSLLKMFAMFKIHLSYGDK